MADVTITGLTRQNTATTGLIVPVSDGTNTIGVPISAIVTATGNMGTGYMQLPVGTGLQSGVEGAMRYNSTLKALEFYNGTKWVGPNYNIEY